jgi:hypothetical protein
MAPVNAGGVLSIQPYYFLAWRGGSFPAVNGSFDSACDWSTLQVALKSASAKSLTDRGATMRRPNTAGCRDASPVHRVGRVSVVMALPHPHRTLARCSTARDRRCFA